MSQPLKFTQKCVSKVIAEADVKFDILPHENCAIVFPMHSVKCSFQALVSLVQKLHVIVWAYPQHMITVCGANSLSCSKIRFKPQNSFNTPHLA